MTPEELKKIALEAKANLEAAVAACPADIKKLFRVYKLAKDAYEQSLCKKKKIPNNDNLPIPPSQELFLSQKEILAKFQMNIQKLIGK